MKKCINRICVVCNKNIYGYKPVGDTKIYYNKKQIGEAHVHNGKIGYAHLKCI